MIISKKIAGILCITAMLQACVEPFEAYTLTFDNALVIEATITNQMKQQEVKLSRTFMFESDGPEPERRADVRVVDDTGTEFLFLEASPGVYKSESAFGAIAGRKYHLEITSEKGMMYQSSEEDLAPTAAIDELYAERTTDENGNEGMAIRVSGSSATDNARNYRYEFEETYKIIAPKWTNKDLIPDPNDRCGVLVVDREKEERVCYATKPNNTILITNTNGFSKDRVSNFLVRFIDRDNYIITHRYSILVRQLVLSSEAYTYYETLGEFSGNQSLFSAIQPGFLQGNVFSSSDPAEKVLGYFGVASASEKRIFFNYDDFFPGEPLPPYINSCAEIAPPKYGKVSGPIPEEFLICVLKAYVELNQIRYVDENEGGLVGEGGPYIVVPRECGDCTALGKIEVPDFWTEE